MGKRVKANSHGKVVGQYPDDNGHYMLWGWRFPDGALSYHPCVENGFRPNTWHSKQSAESAMGLWDGVAVPLVPAA